MSDPREPPRAADEPERLETLHTLGLLDTAPEEAYDCITRLARRIFDVPMALITLVDENRQWFKSESGLGVRETDRRDSFCAHAIADDDLMVVPDTHADERFATNPLVCEEPNIRFYAGVPLHVDHHRVGTLCILDRKQRSLTDREAGILMDLAAVVEREIRTLRMAMVDELTGLANRRGFLALAGQMLPVIERSASPASLVFVDLDGFKAVNDQLGHAVGDKALIAMAEAMRKTFRAADVTGRLSGDEFVALLPDATPDQAEVSVKRLRGNVAALDPMPDTEALAFSAGVVGYDKRRHTSVDALLREADETMYRNKNVTRGAEGGA